MSRENEAEPRTQAMKLGSGLLKPWVADGRSGKMDQDLVAVSDLSQGATVGPWASA